MAGRLSIEWEPLQAPGVEDAAESATWARLKITAQAGNGPEAWLTQVRDLHAKAYRDGVYGTVFPFAEWVVRSWSHTFVSLKAPPRTRGRDAYDWDRVHRWRFSGEGTALPDACFSAVDEERIELRWWRDPPNEPDRHERVLFESQGAVVLSKEVVRAGLQDFVQSVIDRLQEVAPGDARAAELAANWAVVTDPTHPDHAAERFAARVGRYWWGLAEEERHAVRRLSNEPRNVVAERMLDASCFEELPELLEVADQIWSDCRGAPQASVARERLWQALNGSNGHASQTPWHQGWQAARRLRQHAGLPADQRLELGTIDQLVTFAEGPAAPGAVESIVAWEAGRVPVRSMRARGTARADRFALLRDVYPTLFGPAPSVVHASIFSHRVAGSASVANAFAAELTAPVACLQDLIGGRGSISQDDILEMAIELEATAGSVRHQVENHGLARIEPDVA